MRLALLSQHVVKKTRNVWCAQRNSNELPCRTFSRLLRNHNERHNGSLGLSHASPPRHVLRGARLAHAQRAAEAGQVPLVLLVAPCEHLKEGASP